MKKRLIPFICALALFSCKKGEPLGNIAPDTKISISKINLVGPDRLTTEITLHWSGEDVDGYVKGYEISFDESTWSAVGVQDSTFNFSISGSDTINIDFFVRAIDNEDLADRSPAYLLLPLKNSPPVAKFDSINVINDTVWSVFSALWNVTDLDGNATLDSIFIRINNSNWYPLAPEIKVGTFVPNNPEISGSANCKFYRSLDPVLVAGDISGLLIEGNNRLYIRAKDIAGSFSEIDSTKVFYVKRKTSDLLVVDSHIGGSSPSPEEVYLPLITTVYGGYDYINLERNSGENIPAFWEPTFSMLMSLYDKVFWYADATRYDNQLYLEAAAGGIQSFINQGGKIFITAQFPNDFDNASTVVGFSPMDSLSTSTGQARISSDSLIMPYGMFASGYDSLQPSSLITSADPFYIAVNADTMFTAQVTRTGGWSGPVVVAGRLELSPGKTNQVFFSLELHKLNGNPTALEKLFSQVLLNEFNW